MTSHVIAYRSTELLFGTQAFNSNCFFDDFNCIFTQIRCLSRLLVLVQPRKTRPFITERLLMGRKESNQTNKILRTRTPYTLANSEDADERPHNVAFHQGLHCLLGKK